MKKATMTILIATAISFGAAGCGREIIVVQAPPVTDAVTTTTDAPVLTAPITTAPRQLTNAERFINDTRYETDLMFMSDAELLEFGELVCDFFRAGGTSAQLVRTIAEAGLESGASEETMLDYAAAADNAVLWLCPDQRYKTN